MSPRRIEQMPPPFGRNSTAEEVSEPIESTEALLREVDRGCMVVVGSAIFQPSKGRGNPQPGRLLPDRADHGVR